jgi:hypothetical protein
MAIDRTITEHPRDSEPDHTTPASGLTPDQIILHEGESVARPALPEGTHCFVISASTGPKMGSRPWPTFIGLTVTVAEGPHAGRSFEQKVFRTVTNYGEKQRLVSATDLARATEEPDAPERTFEQTAEVIEQARQQRLPFRAKVTWGAMDHAALEQRAGRGGNARGRSMIWGADRFDQANEHGLPVARGVDGQLLWPQEYITRFLRRPKGGFPVGGAVAGPPATAQDGTSR